MSWAVFGSGTANLGILLGGVTATCPASPPLPGDAPLAAWSTPKVFVLARLLRLNQSITFLAGPVEAWDEVESELLVPAGGRLFGFTAEEGSPTSWKAEDDVVDVDAVGRESDRD